MPNYYDNWREEEFDCPACKWHGPGSALSLGDYTLDYAERVCPVCEEFMTIVLHPTIAECRANWDKVSEWDRKQIEAAEARHAEFERRKLREPSQLPDIHGDYSGSPCVVAAARKESSLLSAKKKLSRENSLKVPSEQNPRAGATFTLTRFRSSITLRRHRSVQNSLAKAWLLLLPVFGVIPTYSTAAEPTVSAARDQNQFVTQPRGGRFCVALDIGHLPTAGGAMGADGRMEYEFNRRMVELIAADLQQDRGIRVVVVNREAKRISLGGRAAAARAAGADLLLSIHHDSVNDRYLETERQTNGRVLHYCDRFRGYSVFYSGKNHEASRSLDFAQALGLAMRRHGLTPTLHHAERIKGENRELVNPDLGIYRFDDLIVLKSAAMPAALLECGVIVNRSEEAELLTEERQQKVVAAIHKAVIAMAEN